MYVITPQTFAYNTNSSKTAKFSVLLSHSKPKTNFINAYTLTSELWPINNAPHLKSVDQNTHSMFKFETFQAHELTPKAPGYVPYLSPIQTQTHNSKKQTSY